MKAQILDDNTTAKVADLIKIKIPTNELSNYTKQLNTVLDAVTLLSEVDTKNVKPTAQTHGLTNVWREDVATPGLDMAKYKNRRNFKNGYFVVKKVI